MIVRRIKFLSQSSLPADGGTTVVGGDFSEVRGIDYPHEIPAVWEGPCESAQPAVASGAAWQCAILRIVDWLWAGLSLAIIFALLILWWA